MSNVELWCNEGTEKHPKYKLIGTQEGYPDDHFKKLFKEAWKIISKIVTTGFPEWYKEQLAKSQFEEK